LTKRASPPFARQAGPDQPRAFEGGEAMTAANDKPTRVRSFEGAADCLAAALRGDAGDVREAVAWVIQATLEAEGVSPEAARAALLAVGYRPPRETLEALFRGAWLREKIERDLGIFKRGSLKGIHYDQAAIWADESGQPDYDGEAFRKAYAAWLRRTGGGIGRARTPENSRKKRRRLAE